MILVDKNGKQINIGDRVMDFRGNPLTIIAFQLTNSWIEVQGNLELSTHVIYANVINAEWKDE